MRVKIKLFARLRDLAGISELDADLGSGATIRDVWDTVTARHPDLAPYAASMSAARNLEYARMTATVEDGDEIAFLPPVSGG